MSLFIYIDIMLFGFLCIISYEFIRARRIRINNQILFSFCDLRRELMASAREGRIDVTSLSFQLRYSSLSKLIHYIRDYKFLSDLFLEILCKEEDTEASKKIEAWRTDLLVQGEPMISIDKKYFQIMDDSFLLADSLFTAKYNCIMDRKKRQQYKRQKEEFKSHYQGHGSPSLRLA